MAAGGSLRRCQKIRPAASNPAYCPGAAGYPTRSGGGCPARQAGPGGGAGGRAGHADAGSGCRSRRGDQRLACQPACPGRRGGARLACHRAARAEAGRAAAGHLPAAAQPLCRRTSPVALRARPGAGQGGQLPAATAVGAATAGALPLVTVAIPGSRAARRTAKQRMAGAGAYHSPCTSRVPAVYLPWTWPRNSRPAANLTPPAPGPPGSRPGPGRCPPGPGHCQVHERSTPGRREVCGRAARGPSQVCARSMAAGCMGFRTRPLPVTRSPPCVMTPGPAARPAGQETASQSRRPCWPPRSPAAPCSARWIPRTRPSGR